MQHFRISSELALSRVSRESESPLQGPEKIPAETKNLDFCVKITVFQSGFFMSTLTNREQEFLNKARLVSWGAHDEKKGNGAAFLAARRDLARLIKDNDVEGFCGILKTLPEADHVSLHVLNDVFLTAFFSENTNPKIKENIFSYFGRHWNVRFSLKILERASALDMEHDDKKLILNDVLLLVHDEEFYHLHAYVFGTMREDDISFVMDHPKGKCFSTNADFWLLKRTIELMSEPLMDKAVSFLGGDGDNGRTVSHPFTAAARFSVTPERVVFFLRMMEKHAVLRELAKKENLDILDQCVFRPDCFATLYAEKSFRKTLVSLIESRHILSIISYMPKASALSIFRARHDLWDGVLDKDRKTTLIGWVAQAGETKMIKAVMRQNKKLLTQKIKSGVHKGKSPLDLMPANVAATISRDLLDEGVAGIKDKKTAQDLRKM